ncbi:hypothetical protein DRP07_01845 [Archaeoglobales archaeon]|nr:MAG: hypothetical protein DRP07_01845 [Archaeoglobales archaeon]
MLRITRLLTTFSSNNYGTAVIEVDPNSTYEYSVSKDGYYSVHDSVTVGTEQETVTVTLIHVIPTSTPTPTPTASPTPTSTPSGGTGGLGGNYDTYDWIEESTSSIRMLRD